MSYRRPRRTELVQYIYFLLLYQKYLKGRVQLITEDMDALDRLENRNAMLRRLMHPDPRVRAQIDDGILRWMNGDLTVYPLQFVSCDMLVETPLEKSQVDQD